MCRRLQTRIAPEACCSAARRAWRRSGSTGHPRSGGCFMSNRLGEQALTAASVGDFLSRVREAGTDANPLRDTYQFAAVAESLSRARVAAGSVVLIALPNL